MKPLKTDYSKFQAVEPYLLSNSLVLTSGGSGILTFTIDSNYDYEWYGFTYKATGEFKFQPVIDQKQLFKNYVNNYGFAGRISTTQIGLALWFNFKMPYVCARNSTLSINLVDLSSSSNTVEFTLNGLKLLYSV